MQFYLFSHSSSPIVTQIGHSHFGGLLIDQYFGRVDYISTLSISCIFCYTFSHLLFLLGSGLFRFDIIQTARLAGQGATLLSSIIITDSLMIIGLGLLIGMNRRILSRYKLIMKSAETP